MGNIRTVQYLLVPIYHIFTPWINQKPNNVYFHPIISDPSNALSSEGHSSIHTDQ